MKQPKAVFFDGMKSMSVFDVDDVSGWTYTNQGEKSTEATFFKTVPWLYRGVTDRANNVGRMPFSIMQGDEELDTSGDYQNTIDCMPNPTVLFKKLEMSLTMTGKAYALKEMNKSGYVKNLKYLIPTSITEVYDDHGELTHYERTYKSKKIDIAPELIVPVYVPDYNTETGPGTSSPAKAALSSAGVLYNVDEFVADFFARGAIKATVFSVKGYNTVEAKKFQKWVSDVVNGIKNAWSTQVLSGESVTPTVIGEGIESLQNESLTTERRQNIATALGVPESRMWSAAANYATRVQDDKAYFEGTIIPECDLIAEAFNSELFTVKHKLDGYKLKFQYETLDVFQDNAMEQAGAFSSFVNSKMPMVLAAYLVGLELTEEQIAILDEIDNRPPPPQLAPFMGGETQPEEDEEEDPAEEDLRKWTRKALKLIAKGKPPACKFESDNIPASMNGAIEGMLEECYNENDVKALFAQSIEWVRYP